MGRQKPWLPWEGKPLLSHVVSSVQPLVQELVVVARPGQDLPVTPARTVWDRIEGAGPLGGLESGLAQIKSRYAIVVACDMPWLNPDLLKEMVKLSSGCDLVIPYLCGHLQPLHAIYAKRLQPLVEKLLSQGERRMDALVGCVRTRLLEESFLSSYDPVCRSVRGLNDWNHYKACQANFGKYDSHHSVHPRAEVP
jgi:molybdopterin-guanine dinucleotide biosynthesis protein A